MSVLGENAPGSCWWARPRWDSNSIRVVSWVRRCSRDDVCAGPFLSVHLSAISGSLWCRTHSALLNIFQNVSAAFQKSNYSEIVLSEIGQWKSVVKCKPRMHLDFALPSPQLETYLSDVKCHACASMRAYRAYRQLAALPGSPDSYW